jgi:putative restriction endonuclease
MKMCNFARFDPALRARGIAGLENGSGQDEEVWNEFNEDWESLVYERASILTRLQCSSDISVENEKIPAGTDRIVEVKARINQDFFRKSLLSAYENRCCITGLNATDLLIASHIKPWSVSDPKRERTSPSNGLLLNAFHDKAFDKGYMTIDRNYLVHISPKIRAFLPTAICDEWMLRYEGVQIHLPKRFEPKREYIEYHNELVFIS